MLRSEGVCRFVDGYGDYIGHQEGHQAQYQVTAGTEQRVGAGLNCVKEHAQPGDGHERVQ